MNHLATFIKTLLSDHTVFTAKVVDNTTTAIVLFVILLACFIAYWLSNRVVLRVVQYIVERTKNSYDDILLERRVFSKLAQIAPAIILHYTLPSFVDEAPQLGHFLGQVTQTWIVLVLFLTFLAFLDALNDIYQHSKISRNRSIKGYLQLIKVLLSIVVIFTFMEIFIQGFQMSKVFTGLGAMAAVLMLVFRDTILSLVASIQIGANDMVRLGDWIVLPKYGADGEVTEISLNTIKIQNWDKTISTVPVYALVSDSFQNWRGMSDSGGRRIKRSLNIDMKSVGFASSELLDKLSQFYLLKEYISDKEHELKERNAALHLPKGQSYNASRQTNLGIFRKYLENYLHSLPVIHEDMTFLVRHLQPTEKGLPIEIYVFSRKQDWAVYEGIQADIFDHILAIIPEFELRIFQNPTGDDLARLIP